MSSGLYSGVSGLALGAGLYRSVSGLWSGASGLIAGFDGGNPYSGASLYLDFLSMTAPTFDSRITFSRGSNATVVDNTGRVTYAPANLLTYSQEIATYPWVGDTAGGTIPTVTNNAGVAPDGTTTATRVQIDRGAGTFSRWAQNITVGTAGIYLASIWMRTTSGTGTANVGLRNETTGVNCVVTGTWQRFWIANTTATTAPSLQMLSWTSLPGTDVSVDILAWGAQLEPVTYQTTPSAYAATTSAAYYGPRFDYDPVTLAPKGLLIEEQRANLLAYSAQFDDPAWSKQDVSVSANATTSPDGTANADNIIPNTTNTPVHRVLVSTAVSSTQHSLSIYAKASGYSWLKLRIGLFYANFNVSTGAIGVANTGTTASITDAGNGWYRCTITCTPAANAVVFIYPMPTNNADLDPVSYAGDGTSGIFIYGAQLEAGAFATSYIPTVASTVTRSADVATMTGTNFSSWYNQSEGTFVAVGDYVSRTNFRIFMTADNAPTVTSRIMINGDQTQQLVVSDSGSTVVNLTAGTAPEANIPTQIAAAYLLNDFAVVRDGGTVATDNSGTVPTLNRLAIGYYPNGALYLNGHIREIAYFNTRQSNTRLQTLTAPPLVTTLSLDFTSGTYLVGY